jgi:hypothetical protein
MCLACEEQEMMFRYFVEQALAAGEISEGLTVEDLRMMGYELPPGTQPATTAEAPAAPKRASAFVCDSPDGE